MGFCAATYLASGTWTVSDVTTSTTETFPKGISTTTNTKGRLDIVVSTGSVVGSAVSIKSAPTLEVRGNDIYIDFTYTAELDYGYGPHCPTAKIRLDHLKSGQYTVHATIRQTAYLDLKSEYSNEVVGTFQARAAVK